MEQVYGGRYRWEKDDLVWKVSLIVVGSSVWSIKCEIII